MLNRWCEDVVSLDQDLFIAVLRFVINGTTHPAVWDGAYFAAGTQPITRNGAGNFDVALLDTIGRVYYVSPPSIHANADHTGIVTGITQLEGTGTKVINIRTKTGGSDADPADTTIVTMVIIGTLTTQKVTND